MEMEEQPKINQKMQSNPTIEFVDLEGIQSEGQEF